MGGGEVGIRIWVGMDFGFGDEENGSSLVGIDDVCRERIIGVWMCLVVVGGLVMGFGGGVGRWDLWCLCLDLDLGGYELDFLYIRSFSLLMVLLLLLYLVVVVVEAAPIDETQIKFPPTKS